MTFWAVIVLIPQFDFTTLSVVLFSSLLSAVLYYVFISLRLLPEIITVLKFRTKKLFKENFGGKVSVCI